MDIFSEILKKRGLDTPAKQEAFLNPDYGKSHDPFLLPDMAQAVDRLVKAKKAQEHITIYGDYDIDGLTATAILIDALSSFGFKHVDAFIPNRFVEGYGLTVDAIERIAKAGANLIITVDCGSLSHTPIARANELGVDVIVTDHHNVADEQPSAVAVINPKRLMADNPDAYQDYALKDSDSSSGKLYPFLDLAGCGVAFKLVRALQTRLEGLPDGQEKWLLDLVALGTVCDVVTLVDENRTNVFWGLKVLAKAKRPGLRALMAVAGIDPAKLNARSLGFGLGPRMNAAGRLETAQIALDMLMAANNDVALDKAQQLNVLNTARKNEQDKIYKAAVEQALKYENDDVLVVSAPDWNHGIVGIVAAKLLERFKKPTFVLQEMGEESKGSARSFGGFSVADAIKDAGDIVTKGGGHKLAAGLTLPTKNINAFRTSVNNFYDSQNLVDQADLLLPDADVEALFDDVNEELVGAIRQLEPFGNGNLQPVIKSTNLLVLDAHKMGADAQHVKLDLQDSTGKSMRMIAFSAPPEFFVKPGQRVSTWYYLDINEWNGYKSIEGKLLRVEAV